MNEEVNSFICKDLRAPYICFLKDLQVQGHVPQGAPELRGRWDTLPQPVRERWLRVKDMIFIGN